MGAVILLASLGILRLLRERAHAVVIGLVGLGPGVALFLILLAARGVVVPIRYAAPIDMAVIFAAGLGLGPVLERLAGWPSLDGPLRRMWARIGAPGMVAVVAAASMLLTGPYWHTNSSLRSVVRSSLRLASDADRAVAALDVALQGQGGIAVEGPRVLVPGPVWPRIAIDLGLPLTEIATSDGTRLESAGYLVPGQFLFHDRAGDSAAAAWVDFEISEPHALGSLLLDPLLVDPSGMWVLAVR
jgi:hypothetical protein